MVNLTELQRSFLLLTASIARAQASLSLQFKQLNLSLALSSFLTYPDPISDLVWPLIEASF